MENIPVVEITGKVLKRANALPSTQIKHVKDHFQTLNSRDKRLTERIKEVLGLEEKGSPPKAYVYGKIYYKLTQLEAGIAVKVKMRSEWDRVVPKGIPFPIWLEENDCLKRAAGYRAFVEARKNRVDYSRVDLLSDHYRWLGDKSVRNSDTDSGTSDDDRTIAEKMQEKSVFGWLGSFLTLSKGPQKPDVSRTKGRFEPKNPNFEKGSLKAPDEIHPSTGAIYKQVTRSALQSKPLGQQTCSTPKVDHIPRGFMIDNGQKDNLIPESTIMQDENEKQNDPHLSEIPYPKRSFTDKFYEDNARIRQNMQIPLKEVPKSQTAIPQQDAQTHAKSDLRSKFGEQTKQPPKVGFTDGGVAWNYGRNRKLNFGDDEMPFEGFGYKQPPFANGRVLSSGLNNRPPASVGHLAGSEQLPRSGQSSPSAPEDDGDSDSRTPGFGGETTRVKRYDRHLYEMIDKFKGDPLKFGSFIEAFCEAVDNTDLPVAFKLNRLKNKLDERSRAMIEDYPPTQYEKAKKTLLNRYSILVNITRNIRKKANELPSLKRTDDIETFGRIVEQLRAIIELVKNRAIDDSVQIDIFRTVMSKLPFRVYDTYTEYLKDDPPNLNDFLEVVESKYQAALNQQFYSPDDKDQGKKPFRKEPKGQVNSVESHKNRRDAPPPFTGGGSVRGRGGRELVRPRDRNDQNEQKGTWNDPCKECPNSSHSALYCRFVSVKDKIGIARANGLCFRCLKPGHSSLKCLSKEKCRHCGETRHHNQLCFKATRPKKGEANNVRSYEVRSRQYDSEGEFDDSLKKLLNETTDHMYNVESSGNSGSLIPVLLKVNGQRLKGLLDTGATVNLMPTSLAEKLGLPLESENRALRTPQGEFSVTKATDILVQIGLRTRTVRFLLYDGRKVILLGTPVIQKFKLVIDFNLNVHQLGPENGGYISIESPPKECVLGVSGGENVEFEYDEKTLKEVLRANKSAFSEDGRKIGLITTEKCHLRLTSEVPINLRPYRCSVEDQEIIDAHVKELMAQGLVRDSTSPYSFPVVLVDKKDEGRKSRVCINYIKLNEVTQTEHFPIMKIDDIKDMFLGARYFTTVDIASGFHHIQVNESDVGKTAFSTMNGHYEWLRMPFGLKNAPVIFQRVIANLIKKHGLQKFTLNYIDDIMVFSRTYDEHMQHLQLLFDMVKAEDIRLKLSKCQFGKKEVVYLGFKIGQDSFAPLQSNTVAIEQAPPPTDLKTLRGFLGKINFYHRFIPNRAVLLYPLYQLLKKQIPWDWGEEAQKAFEAVKVILTSAPVLRIFDPKCHTFLYTDASRKGIGAVLKQSDPSDPEAYQYAIGYFSKPLVSYQQNYAVSELELLAIVSAIDYWHYYLISVFFTVITDHLPLKAVNKFSKPSTRLFNWAMRLRQYRFKVEYLPGAQNHEADYLSRHPVRMLEEITAGHVMWVSAEKIKTAQASMTDEDLPRRVWRVEREGQSKLVYFKGDQEKDYLPNELAREVLEELHLGKGHIGYKAMERHFTKKYYCTRLPEMIKKIIRGCLVCVQVKVPHLKYGTMGMIGPAERPMEIVHIDTKSGFKGYGSQKDNLHIAIDAFTRFVWAITSRSKLGVDFINLIEKVNSLEKPRLIVADNYPAIKGREFQNYLKHNEIGMIFVAANHQSANGMVERVNQTLVERLRCKRLEKPRLAWTTLVKECIHEYNNSIHSVTRFTPMYLLIGEDRDGLFKDYTLEEARELAFENSNERHSDNARMKDKGKRDPALEPEDLVYVQAQHSLNRKALDPPYVGPYPVKERIGRTTYEVCKGGKVEKYHVSQMKALDIPKFLPRRNSMTAALMVLLCFIISTGAQQVTTTGPLLWRKTDNPAVVGFDYATHVAVLPNPCDILKPDRMKRTPPEEIVLKVEDSTASAVAAEPDMATRSKSLTDYVTCSDYYQERVLDHLQKECKVADTVSVLGKQSHRVTRRNKRFLPLIAGAIGGIISYGFLGLLPDWRPMSTDTVQNINNQMKEQLDLIKAGDELTRKFQEGVVAQLEATAKLTTAMKAESKAIRLLTAIFALLSKTEIHLQYLLEGFHHGKVTPDYKMLFPGSPFLNGTPLRYWTSHGCEMVNGTFVMKFEKPILSTTIKVLRVAPFMIIGKGKEDQECLMSFKGNQYVLWNNETNCTRDLLSEPQYPSDLVIVNDSPLASCISHSNRTEKWQNVECENSSLKEQTLQVHRDENTYLVYCYGRELKVEGNDPFTCKNTVYRFPASLTFWVDGNAYTTKTDYLDSKFDIGMAITDLINHRTFFPSIGLNTKALKDLSELIQEEKVIEDQLKWKPLVKNPFFHLSVTMMIVIIIILIILLICCVKFCPHGPRYGGKYVIAGRGVSRENNEMELL